MTATITHTYSFSEDDKAHMRKMLEKKKNGGPPDAQENVFPADPTNAPFPSPENAQQIVHNGRIGGRPYLRDQAGAVHQIKMLNGVPVYTKMGQVFPVFPGEAVAQILVRQGEVYMQITSGI